MFTILWCYTRNNGFKKDGKDYHTAADLTSQANHLGVTIKADIIKQKLPTTNGGFTNVGFAKSHPAMYDSLCTDHPIDLCRYQVANCYMGRIGLINSGGASGDNDFAEAVETAIINKRAGGMGLILGRRHSSDPSVKAFACCNRYKMFTSTTPSPSHKYRALKFILVEIYFTLQPLTHPHTVLTR